MFMVPSAIFMVPRGLYGPKHDVYGAEEGFRGHISFVAVRNALGVRRREVHPVHHHFCRRPGILINTFFQSPHVQLSTRQISPQQMLTIMN